MHAAIKWVIVVNVRVVQVILMVVVAETNYVRELRVRAIRLHTASSRLCLVLHL